MKHSDGELTRIEFGKMFEYDDDSFFPGIEDISRFDDISLFKEFIKKRLSYLLNEKLTTDDRIVTVLVSLCEDAGVNISRQTIKNWITKSAPDGNKISRENVYKLCFALKMDDKQTEEFFLKAYLERPFNYKDIHEAVYYYCLKSGKNFSKAEQLICIIESTPGGQKKQDSIMTVVIGEEIEKIEDEDKFIAFMIENRANFELKNQTAIKTIEMLIKSTMEIAEAEFNKFNQEEPIKVNSIDDLLWVIYGYSMRKKDKPKITIKDSDFPKYIKRNFPERQQFEDIINGKGSYDSIRKALIMLKFYNFYAEASIEGANEFEIFDEFIDEMDLILTECGYVQLYWRNPYDWMIGYCATQANPLDTLREFIEELYLSKADQ